MGQGAGLAVGLRVDDAGVGELGVSEGAGVVEGVVREDEGARDRDRGAAGAERGVVVAVGEKVEGGGVGG
mgnify:CR=1 FL=1